MITIGRSSTLMLDKFAAPFRDGLQGIRREDFFCPGSVRAGSGGHHASASAYGMKEDSNAYFANSMVLEPVAFVSRP